MSDLVIFKVYHAVLYSVSRSFLQERFTLLVEGISSSFSILYGTVPRQYLLAYLPKEKKNMQWWMFHFLLIHLSDPPILWWINRPIIPVYWPPSRKMTLLVLNCSFVCSFILTLYFVFFPVFRVLAGWFGFNWGCVLVCDVNIYLLRSCPSLVVQVVTDSLISSARHTHHHHHYSLCETHLASPSQID